ncbi:hypothetical protein [Mariniblastus fucicola]|uniref:Cytochrome C n=1 Tax=Mariniblastus fucicola TaxID=980251 RepID=A0A5B9PE70_9BACT|nr:hypothetical protein [Mariniblastus fucicola]QEG23232.1 hypothetical protein MFFC18_31280 [Mariniblastus fucicola]
MKMFSIASVVCCVVVGVSFAYATTQDPQEKSDSKPVVQESKEDSDESADAVTFEPVDNMHHFMEYICQPCYRSLKESFAGEPPENRRAWKSIKSNALILTETTALLADRVPKNSSDEQAALWREISHDVYTSGKALYKSAGDFEAATRNYGAMIESCNKCHQEFAKGKYQLKK